MVFGGLTGLNGGCLRVRAARSAGAVVVHVAPLPSMWLRHKIRNTNVNPRRAKIPRRVSRVCVWCETYKGNLGLVASPRTYSSYVTMC